MKTIHIITAAVLLLLIISCEKASFEKQPDNNPEALFEDLWNTFRTDYAGFEVRGVDWQLQYETFRPQVNENTSDEELIGVFKQMLRTLNDGHVSFAVPDQEVFVSNLIYDQKIGSELFDLDLIEDQYMKGEFSDTYEGSNIYGWIGNVGYLYFEGFRANILELGSILDSFKAADGLVFDLRSNQGGDFTYAITEFSRLTEKKRLVFRSRTKNGTGEADYTDWYDWYVEPSGDYFDKPIVLLTDRLTISAGERAVQILMALPNVTVLGDTTNGAFSTKIGKELANGWNYAVAPQHVEFIDGINYEGTGMPPDIYMKNTQEEIMNGQDRVLEEALARFK
jgi:carboxyl-terminal processing protease